MRLFLQSLVLAGLALGLVACESIDTSPSSNRERLQELEQAIEAEIGEARADSVQFCRTVAFGSKPCGGPWEYLVYSVTESDEPRLKELVAEYNALQAKINQEEGLFSNCAFVTRPDTTLVDGQCVKASSH